LIAILNFNIWKFIFGCNGFSFLVFFIYDFREVADGPIMCGGWGNLLANKGWWGQCVRGVLASLFLCVP
jgi:hypothetical protein